MFSVSPAEIVTIALVALVIFGPRRLPEISKKIGRILREVTQVAQELKTGLEREYGEALEPLDDVRRNLGETVKDPKPRKDEK